MLLLLLLQPPLVRRRNSLAVGPVKNGCAFCCHLAAAADKIQRALRRQCFPAETTLAAVKRRLGTAWLAMSKVCVQCDLIPIPSAVQHSILGNSSSVLEMSWSRDFCGSHARESADSGKNGACSSL